MKEQAYNVEQDKDKSLTTKAGYKMGYFKGMSYDEIRPIFEEEYNKIQTLFKKDTKVEKTKTKRIAEETLLQECFKKLRTSEALRLFELDKHDGLWKLQRYMYDPLTWRLYGTCGVHHVSSTRGHDIYMLIEKDYLLSTAVMNLMLSRRLQVEEDSEMARDLIIAKVGTLAYRLKLSEQLSRVHSTFHVSNLKKCLIDKPLAIPLDEIQIHDKLNFIEEPVEIIDQEVKRMKQSCIPIMKIIIVLSFTSVVANLRSGGFIRNAFVFSDRGRQWIGYQ
ncbi:hypothetical protein Tco_0655697, partial [Tanacetum coccineum]